MSPTAPYTNDSLRWVAVEVRYPPLDSLAQDIPAPIRAPIQERFPVQEQGAQLAMTLGPSGPLGQQSLQHRFLDRDRLTSVTVRRDALSLETTDYPGWSGLLAIFMEAVGALEAHARPTGLMRIGLRYVDEIRLPDPPQDFAGWRTWIDDRLISYFDLDAALSPTNATVALQYGIAPGHVTIFRAAPFPEGRTVQEQGLLRMPFHFPDGPYFLLDTDASWMDPERRVPEFDAAFIAARLEELHSPCHRLFEAAITDRLRDEVLRRPREEVWS